MNNNDVVKLDNIQVGMVVKNYKEMCKILDEKVTSGNAKTTQLKRWKRFFDWDKDGYKFIIKEIYKEPKSKKDERKKRAYTVEESCFNVCIEEGVKPGVYKIESDDAIYIGSTIKGLRYRFVQHYNNHGGVHTKTYNLLHNGGIFTCLQSFEKGTDEKTIRECEAEYIRLYKTQDKPLLNTEIPVVLNSTARNKDKYETIKIPEEFIEDVKNILVKEGYLILDKIMFNKKFTTED